MASKSRKGSTVGEISNQGDKKMPEGPPSACRKVLEEGAASVTGAALLSIAAVEDMLSGYLTPQEATVVNTTSGRILKAAELFLKHGRKPNATLDLPSLSGN